MASLGESVEDVPYAVMDSQGAPHPAAEAYHGEQRTGILRTRTVMERAQFAQTKLFDTLQRARTTVSRNGPLAWTLFLGGAALEVIGAVLPVLRTANDTGTWKLYVWSTLVRVMVWFAIATVVAPDVRAVIEEHCKLDSLFLSGLGSLIGYVFMVHFSLGEYEWRRAAQGSYLIYLFFFLGYFRVMTVHFPFTKTQWYVYKAVRVFVIVFFLNTEVLSQLSSITNNSSTKSVDDEKRRAMQLISIGLTFNFVYDTCIRVIDSMKERSGEISDRMRATESVGRDLELGLV